MGIQIVGSTDTVTTTTSGGSVKITPASINATGVSTFSDIRITGGTIAGVSTAGITTVYIGSVNDGPISGVRNRIINGDMRIDQRNNGASVSAATGVYPVDRFEIENISGGGTATTQRSTTVPTGQGFTNSLLVTVTGTDTSLASSDYYTIRQIIEGQNIADLQFGTNSASIVTISFWVRSSVTGTYCFSLTNGGNSRGYPVEYSISSANTWEKKVITIPGDTSGTWGTDNGRGIQCRFCMGTGTSRQGTANTWNAGEIHGTSNQTNLFATNGATFYITGVQLESGTVATPFERRSYGQELSLCQRYYEKSYEQSVVPGTATGSGYSLGCVNTNTSTTLYSSNIDKFAVVKRAAPAMRFWDIAGNLNRVSSYTLGGLTRTDNSNSVYSYTGFQQNAVMIDTRSLSTMAGYQWEASAEL